MRNDMQRLYEDFKKTNKYMYSTFKEVENEYYNKPDVMNYHMHGLALAQFLWPDQYERFRFHSLSCMFGQNQYNSMFSSYKPTTVIYKYYELFTHPERFRI